MFRRSRPSRQAVTAGPRGLTPGRKTPQQFTTLLKSLRASLYFTAAFEYEAVPAPGLHEPPLHPHAVARSHLREQASDITQTYLPQAWKEAEDAVNTLLSQPLCSEPRLIITAGVSLSLDTETETLSRRQEQAERQLVSADHDETVRLDLLRTRLLDPCLGLMSWLDRHTDTLNAPDHPADTAAAVIASFTAVHTALLRDTGAQAQTALVRARVDELLATLENPKTAQRAAQVLEQLVHIIHSEGRPPTTAG